MNLSKIIGSILIIISSISFAGSHDSLVPGSINPDVTQENIQETICVPGFTKTIRPKPSYTNSLKAKQIVQFGLSGTMQDYEEDHLIPLSVGGHPTDPNNLWPEPWEDPVFDARHKDRLERAVQLDVCGGKLTLKQGQQIFMTDPYKEYVKRYGTPR